ncbi:MAG: EamA family transporter RarD [Acidobacteriota bacterium]|nr:EamA family transporter RarD [Acidobacteriota bacterium]
MDQKKSAGGDSLDGLLLAGSAYAIWGVAPLFWKLLEGTHARELLPHRIIWALLLTLVIQLLRGRMGELGKALRNRKILFAMSLSTLVIACNWFTYMYAVLTERVIQTSLGYYINPLVSIVLGYVFLGERMHRLQVIAVVLGSLGVAWLAVQGNGIPVLSLVIAFSFGFYGLFRKQAPVGPLTALSIETLFLALPSLAFIFWLEANGQADFGSGDMTKRLLIMATGIITAVPLLLFGAGVRRLRLATLGFLQYTAPTCTFMLSVFLYNEPFTSAHKVAFVCIWAALIIYTYSGMRQRGKPT